MDLSIPSSYKLGQMHSPQWFNSQCAKAVKTKNHRFKEWKLRQTKHSRAFYVQASNLCSRTINARISFVRRCNNRIVSGQTGSRSFWSLAKVVLQNFCHSSFPPLKTTLAHLRALLPLSPTFLHLPLLPIPISITKDPSLLSTLHPPSQCPIFKFSTRKVRRVLLQLNSSKCKGPDGLLAIVLKSCASKLASVINKLFQLSYNRGIFPSSWKHAHVFTVPIKGTNLTLEAIAVLQSLLSSLRLWRPLSPNNCLFSLKLTIFFLTTRMALDKPDLQVNF